MCSASISSFLFLYIYLYSFIDNHNLNLYALHVLAQDPTGFSESRRCCCWKFFSSIKMNYVAWHKQKCLLGLSFRPLRILPLLSAVSGLGQKLSCRKQNISFCHLASNVACCVSSTAVLIGAIICRVARLAAMTPALRATF